MPWSESKLEAHDYNQRIWNKDRKPWDGDVGSVEVIRRAMWKLSDEPCGSQSTGSRTVGAAATPASEVRAASLLVALEALNHGAAELGFGNPYDQERVQQNAEKLRQNWMEMKTPKSLRV